MALDTTPAVRHRLVTRSDFDGLVCAALLKELGMLDDILFVHPKDMQDGKIEIGPGDITTNLPYVPGVHLAFDHHALRDDPRRATRRDNHVIVPGARVRGARGLRLLRRRRALPEHLRGDDGRGRQGRRRAVLRDEILDPAGLDPAAAS